MFHLFSLALASSDPPACSEATQVSVVLNEVFPNPDGADAGQEWVELLVPPGEEAADLTGWTIHAGTQSLTSSSRFPPLELQPGEPFVVGGPQGLAVDLPSLGNASSGSADAVQLRDCTDTIADTVVYGGPNRDGFVDDTGDVATSLAPVPGSGRSLGRSPDGADTNANADDFAVLDPTPGAPNEPDPPPCPQPGAPVVINEILVDPEGADEGLEFVELHADAPVDLTGWSLVAATRSDRTKPLPLPSGTTIASLLVVGGAAVPEADVIVDPGLGNGDGTDGVWLIDCMGTIVDTVVYGEAGNDDGIADDQALVGAPYGDPGTGEALARVRDGVDTDSGEDWVVRPLPSPGSLNQREPASGLPSPGCQGPPRVREAPTPQPPDLAWACLLGFGCLVGPRSTSRSARGRAAGR